MPSPLPIGVAVADFEAVEVVLEEDFVEVEEALVEELFGTEVVAAPSALTVVLAGEVLQGGFSIVLLG